MRQLRKYSKYLILPLLIALLAVPMLLSGCGGSSSADAPVTKQTPFDQLRSQVASIESRVGAVETDLGEIDLESLEGIIGSFDNLKAQFSDLVTTFGVLQDALDALALRVDDLEQDEEEPDEEESALALDILEEPQAIVKSGRTYTFEASVENTGTSFGSGQIVLELQIDKLVSLGNVTIEGRPFSELEDSRVVDYKNMPLTEATVVSDTITLDGGDKTYYNFDVTVYYSGGTDSAWIPTLEIAD